MLTPPDALFLFLYFLLVPALLGIELVHRLFITAPAALSLYLVLIFMALHAFFFVTIGDGVTVCNHYQWGGLLIVSECFFIGTLVLTAPPRPRDPEEINV